MNLYEYHRRETLKWAPAEGVSKAHMQKLDYKHAWFLKTMCRNGRGTVVKELLQNLLLVNIWNEN